MSVTDIKEYKVCQCAVDGGLFGNVLVFSIYTCDIETTVCVKKSSPT